MQTIGTFRLGEDIVVALDAVEGDISQVSSIIAAMRGAAPGKPLFTVDRTRPAVPLLVLARPATDDFPAGWNLTLPAASTAGLSPGIYGIDAKITFSSGSIDITDVSALIVVNEAAVQ